MKVLIVSTRDIAGGAARAAFRLFKGLQRIGVDVHMLVLSKASDEPNITGPQSKKDIAFSKIYPSLNGVLLGMLYGNKERRVFSSAVTPHDISRRINEINPDIVNLHWVTDGFLKIEHLKKIRQPIVWSLHDMWPFTGGCHYDLGCGKYLQSCGACPALGSKKEHDMSRWLFNRKKKTFKEVNDLTIVGLSRWLGACAEKSSLLKDRRTEILPNGIDVNIFKPVDKITARKMLNLPLNKKMVLFGAMNPQANPVKGYKHLVAALHHVRNEHLNFLIFGTSYPQKHLGLKYEAHYLGKFADDLSLAVVYSAADVVVVPSVQENLSNVIMEALACGTPVVAFNIGGNGDMIAHQQNGYLAAPLEAKDLANGIDWVIEDADRWHQLSATARKQVVENYSLEKVAYQYKELFSELITKKSPVNA